MPRLINISSIVGLIFIITFSGCITTPAPAITKTASSHVQNADSGSPALTSSAELSPIEIVTEYLAANIQEKAGLKIAGIMAGLDDFTQIFAIPKKANGLFVIRVNELTITNHTGARSAEVKLVLALTAFDGQGRNIYEKTVTSLHVGTVVYNTSIPGTNDLLEEVAKDALKQYVKDPVLRAVLIKLKYAALGNIF